MRLRDYRASDLDAMYALDKVCFERAFRFSRGSMRKFAEDEKALVVIAESDGVFAGFCIVHVEQGEFGRAGYIVTLDVAPEQRRLGVAAALMVEAERLTGEANCAVMALHVYAGNAAAILFYEKIGFTYSHAVRGFYGARRDALVYHRLLPASG